MAPPKIDIPDDVLVRAVREHMERGSNDGGVKKHVKKHGVGYTKLIATIAALTVAINAYTDLQKENLSLAKENRVLFQAVATKVNGMAEELAYMRGRVDGMKHGEAEEAIEDRIKSIEPNGTHDTPTPRKGKRKRKDKPPKAEGVAHVTMKPGQVQQTAPALKVSAYEQLPEDLAELIELEAQAQEQAQEEAHSDDL